MPCCDSLNTPSPRFWAEIFNRGTPAGNFLQLDSSVFNVVTRDDMEVPREFVVNEAGEDRFRRYVPFKSFVNTIEDYPYPYVIGGRCWEFPCVVPSDWSAQHVQKPNNPDTVRDLKRALDVTVNKRGVFNLVFHPHGWIRNDQVVELIDYAVANYGRKVKFLTFREALERLNQNLLDGQPLRPDAGSAPRVWLLDVNGDRVMDVVRRDGDTLHTKVWLPELNDWRRFEQTLMVSKPSFGILGGLATILSGNDQVRLFRFVDGWQEMPFEFGQEVPLTVATWVRESVRDPQAGVGLRDFDGDGECEVYVTRGSAEETRLFHRTPDGSWIPSKLILPAGIVLLPGERDTGVRFVDVNEDGHDDLIFSNHERYALHLLEKSGPGWSNPVLSGTRPDPSASSPVIPPFIRPDGSNNGVWIHSNHLWLQNEDTSRLPDLVDRVSFESMLKRP